MRSEDREMQDAVKWFKNNYGLKFMKPQERIHHSPNEEKNPKKRMRNAAIGVESGFPDLVHTWRGEVWFVEMKIEGGRLSEKQKQWRDWAIHYGLNYKLVVGFEGFKNHVKSLPA